MNRITRISIGAISLLLPATFVISSQEKGIAKNYDNYTDLSAPISKQKVSAVQGAKDVLKFYLPVDQVNSFILKKIAKKDNLDIFTYQVKNGQLIIEGSSTVALTHGFYVWAKSHGYGMVDWDQSTLKIPKLLRDESKTIVQTPFKNHYIFNPVTFGYTMPYWNIKNWINQLNWMAMHGYDLALSLVGTEGIASRIWQRLGLSKQEIENFYVGPAHMPWQRMGNLVNWDKNPYFWDFNNKQIALEHQILNYMKKLGICPIAPGFAGFVPQAILHTKMFKDVHASALKQVVWNTWSSAPTSNHRAYMLDPGTKQFYQLGKMFVQEWEDEFGAMKFFLADAFNEMSIPAHQDKYEYLSLMGEKTYQAIHDQDPQAQWITQGWMLGFSRPLWNQKAFDAFVSKVPDNGMVIIDLAEDYNHHAPSWNWRTHGQGNYQYYIDNQDHSFNNKQWIYSVIGSMGGRTIVNNPYRFFAQGYDEVLQNEKYKSNLFGSGVAMEGFENQSELFELIADVGWTGKGVDFDNWHRQYSLNRYHKLDPAMDTFQQELTSLSNGRDDGPGAWSRLSTWAVRSMQKRPDPYGINQANRGRHTINGLRAFLSLGDKYLNDHRVSELFWQDYYYYGAEYLAILFDRLIDHLRPNLKRANWTKVQDLADNLLIKTDQLLAGHNLLSLKRWVKMARSWGDNVAEKNYYEANAKRLITTWGDNRIGDYAAREWSSLVKLYYKKRWDAYFAHQLDPQVPSNTYKWENQWVETPLDDKLFSKVGASNEKNVVEIINQVIKNEFAIYWNIF